MGRPSPLQAAGAEEALQAGQCRGSLGGAPSDSGVSGISAHGAQRCLGPTAPETRLCLTSHLVPAPFSETSQAWGSRGVRGSPPWAPRSASPSYSPSALSLPDPSSLWPRPCLLRQRSQGTWAGKAPSKGLRGQCPGSDIPSHSGDTRIFFLRFFFLSLIPG